MAELHIEGSVAAGFEPVAEAFRRAFDDLGETGAAVGGYHGGQPVADLWAGEAAPGEPWSRDTIAHLYSVTKPFAAACLLRLADAGQVDLDAPVARYWPAFAQAGKAEVRVRWLLTHQAGLLGLREPLPTEAFYDWDRIVGALEREEPWWPPGTRHGEHASFFGHLVGEVVRRVDGRGLGRFLREEIAAPLDIDVHVGLRPDEEARCATVGFGMGGLGGAYGGGDLERRFGFGYVTAAMADFDRVELVADTFEACVDRLRAEG